MAKTTSKEEVVLTPEQLARLNAQAGTASAGGIRLPVLNRVSLNGNADAVENDKGELVRPAISYLKQIFVDNEEDAKPVSEELGSPIEVIFVKSRRRLVARDSKGFQVMSTSQHASPTSVVALYKEGKMIDKGIAKDLREKYEDLRTIQETYVIMPDGELVLLIAKGSALSKKKDPITGKEEEAPFYEHVKALSKAGGIFSHKTILGGVLEKGAKQYYMMTFEMGRPTTPAEQLQVLEHSDNLTEIITQYDEENAKLDVKAIVEDGVTGDFGDEEKAPF